MRPVLTFRESFLHEMLLSYRSVKVLSLENFPLYGTLVNKRLCLHYNAKWNNSMCLIKDVHLWMRGPLVLGLAGSINQALLIVFTAAAQDDECWRFV